MMLENSPIEDVVSDDNNQEPLVNHDSARPHVAQRVSTQRCVRRES